jgi:hypothetical protein
LPAVHFNPTKKIPRPVIQERYEDEINSMYEEAGEKVKTAD